MEYKPTTTDKEKPVILEDKDYMMYEVLKELVEVLNALMRKLK